MEHDLAPISSMPATILKKIEKSGWVVLCILCVGALIMGSFSYAAGIFVGGTISLGSFRGMDVYFALLFRAETSRIRWWHHVLYGARFLALLAVITLAIGWGHLPVVSVVLGLSAPLAGIISYGAFALINGEAIAQA
mgnify:CR=1 FL=1